MGFENGLILIVFLAMRAPKMDVLRLVHSILSAMTIPKMRTTLRMPRPCSAVV